MVLSRSNQTGEILLMNKVEFFTILAHCNIYIPQLFDISESPRGIYQNFA